MSQSAARSQETMEVTANGIKYLIGRLPNYADKLPDMRLYMPEPGQVTLENAARAPPGEITAETTAVCLIINTGGGNWTMSWLDVKLNQAVVYDFLWEQDDTAEEEAHGLALGRNAGPRRLARHAAIKRALREFVAGTPADTTAAKNFMMPAGFHAPTADTKDTGFRCVQAIHRILENNADISGPVSSGQSAEMRRWWQRVLEGDDHEDVYVVE